MAYAIYVTSGRVQKFCFIPEYCVRVSNTSLSACAAQSWQFTQCWNAANAEVLFCIFTLFYNQCQSSFDHFYTFQTIPQPVFQPQINQFFMNQGHMCEDHWFVTHTASYQEAVSFDLWWLFRIEKCSDANINDTCRKAVRFEQGARSTKKGGGDGQTHWVFDDFSMFFLCECLSMPSQIHHYFSRCSSGGGSRAALERLTTLTTEIGKTDELEKIYNQQVCFVSLIVRRVLFLVWGIELGAATRFLPNTTL